MLFHVNVMNEVHSSMTNCMLYHIKWALGVMPICGRRASGNLYLIPSHPRINKSNGMIVCVLLHRHVWESVLPYIDHVLPNVTIFAIIIIIKNTHKLHLYIYIYVYISSATNKHRICKYVL